MFDQLFDLPSAIKRQLDGPQLEARLRYLSRRAEQGAARITLRQIAYYQLMIIDYLNLNSGGAITLADIEAAAERWVHRRHERPRIRNAYSQASKERFIKIAIDWLRFVGRLSITTPPHPFAPIVSEYVNYMRQERGLSEETIKYRRQVIESFLNKVCQIPNQFACLTIKQIDDALIERVNQGGYARCTVKSQASSLRAFFQFAERRGWCRPGLAEAIRAPRVFQHETLPFGPSWEDVQSLINSIVGNRPVDIRDRALILFFAVYGLRSSEVRRLRLDDIDWKQEVFRLQRAKQGRLQQFPLIQTVGEATLRYLKEVRQRCALREIFLTMCAPFRPLSHPAVSTIVRRRWQSLGITLKHYGPHSLRHAYATRLINQGVSLKEIGDQLGHCNLETTRIYAKVDLKSLREVADFNLGGLL